MFKGPIVARGVSRHWRRESNPVRRGGYESYAHFAFKSINRFAIQSLPAPDLRYTSLFRASVLELKNSTCTTFQGRNLVVYPFFAKEL